MKSSVAEMIHDIIVIGLMELQVTPSNTIIDGITVSAKAYSGAPVYRADNKSFEEALAQIWQEIAG